MILLKFCKVQKIDFQVEGYYKDFNQLTNINRDRTSNDDNQFIVEKGSAKGIDFLTKYKSKELYVWLVYSYSIVERQDGDFTYFPHFDRRHNINFVTSVHLDKKRTWKADVRWNLGSGFPFTQTQGFYENIPFGVFLSPSCLLLVNPYLPIQHLNSNSSNISVSLFFNFIVIKYNYE